MLSCYWGVRKTKAMKSGSPWMISRMKGDCTILPSLTLKGFTKSWDTTTFQNSNWNLFVILPANIHLTSFPCLVSVRVSMRLLTAGRQLVGHDCCLWHGEWLSSWCLVFPPSVCHICLLCFVLSLHCKLFRVGFLLTFSEVQKNVGFYFKNSGLTERISNNQLWVFKW